MKKAKSLTTQANHNNKYQIDILLYIGGIPFVVKR